MSFDFLSISGLWIGAPRVGESTPPPLPSTSYLKHCYSIGSVLQEKFPIHQNLSSYWNVISGEFYTLSGGLLVRAPGEIEYIANDLPVNAAVVTRYFSTPDMKIEIRGRRSSPTDYIALRLDYETGVVSLIKVTAGIESVLKQQSHELRDNTFYVVGLWMYDDSIMGFINGSYIIDTTTTFNASCNQFSLYIPEIWDNIPTVLYSVIVNELEAYPSEPTIADNPLDYPQQYRKILKQSIEEPTDRDYNTFVFIRTRWMCNKDFGKTDTEWALLGYPIYEPLAEEWFAKSYAV